MGSYFETLALKFVDKASLIKLMNNGNKLLAEIGSQTIEAIINNL